MKQSKWRRLLAASLSIFILLSTLPAGVLAAEVTSDRDPYVPEVTQTVTYNKDMSEAKITYQLKPLEQQKVNVFFLAAADKDNKDIVQYALDDGLHDYYYAGKMLMEWGEPNPTRIITYGEETSDSGVLTNYNSLQTASSISQMSGTGNEVKALQAVTAAVNEADSRNPSVVLWLMGSKTGINSDEADVKAELEKLKGALGDNGALIVYEYTEAPTTYLSDYVASYTKGDGSSAKADFAYGSVDNGHNSYAYDLGHNIRTVVMDNYDVYDTQYGDVHQIGYTRDPVKFTISLDEAQSVITGITGVEVRDERHYSGFSEENRPQTDEHNVSSGIGVTASLDPDTNTVTISADYLFSLDTLRITLTVKLDSTKTDEQTVIHAQDVAFKLRTGLFDDIQKTVTASFPAVAINLGERTISYDLNGGTGTAPASQNVTIGSSVTLADSSAFSKAGESFCGWQVVSGPDSLVGKTLKPGTSLTMGTDNMVLKALWAHPVVTLEVGQATPAPEQTNGQRIADNAGRAKFGSTNQVGLLNFWGLKDRNNNNIYYIDSIVFADEELSYTDAPDTTDRLKVTVDDREDILYARQIGAEGSSVIVYLTAGKEAEHYNMTIAGKNGVVAPADGTLLFAHGMAGDGNTIQIGVGGWNSTVSSIQFNGNFDTSELTTAYSMFRASGLTSLDAFEELDLSSLTNASSMFSHCTALTEVDFSSWNTPALTDISFMLQYCTSLTSVKLSGWDVSKVVAANSMFRSCEKLNNVDMAGWSLPEVTNLQAFFYQCSALKTADISSWNPIKVTDMSYLFADCGALSSVAFGKNWNLPNLTALYNAFQNCTSLTKMDLSGWTTPALGNVMNIFYGCSQMETMGLPGGAKFQDMSFAYAFWELANLKEFIMPAWTLDGLNNYSLTTRTSDSSLWGNYSDKIPKNVRFVIDGWNVTTENFLTDAVPEQFMYPWTYRSKAEFSAKNWNLNDLTQDLSELTALTGYQSLVEFSGWTGLGGVTSISGMFHSQGKLTTVSFAGANFGSLKTASRMFDSDATSLTSLDFSGITGITDRSVLSDMFVGLPEAVKSTVKLKVTDDEIGNWIAEEFKKAGGLENNITKLQAGTSEATANLAAPAAHVMSTSAGSLVSARTAAALAVPAALDLSSDDMIRHGTSSSMGEEYYIKATVRFEGDPGAQSGDINLSVVLPQNMSFATEPEIVTSSFVTTADPSVNSNSGHVKTAAAIANNNLTATLTGMEAGTQIQISFRGILSGDGSISGNQKVWDVTASAADSNTASDCTYRFWQNYSSGSGGSVSSYTLRYVTNGGSTIGSESKRSAWTKAYEDLPVPVRAGYVFEGWYRNSALTTAVTGDVYVHSGTVTLYAKWSEAKVLTPDDTGVSDWLNTKDHFTYLQGMPNDRFGPEQNITRAEVAQMFYNLLLDQKVPAATSFTDVAADAWYADAVNTLASMGILNGVGGGRFEPARDITRAEFTAIAMRFANLDTSGSNPFSDVSADDWFYGEVVGSVQYGWIKGFTDGTFRPYLSITRSEATVITNRMLGRSADQAYVNQHSGELRRFTDVGTDNWAYYDIAEATNGHDYTLSGGAEKWLALQ